MKHAHGLLLCILQSTHNDILRLVTKIQDKAHFFVSPLISIYTFIHGGLTSGLSKYSAFKSVITA